MNHKKIKYVVTVVFIAFIFLILPQKSYALILPWIELNPEKDVITDTNAFLNATIENESGEGIKEVGIVVYKDQVEIKRMKKDVTRWSWKKTFDISFNVYNELGLALIPSTVYDYRIYFVTSEYSRELGKNGTFTTEKAIENRETSATVYCKEAVSGNILKKETITGLLVGDTFQFEPEEKLQIEGDKPRTYLYEWSNEENKIQIPILSKDTERNEIVIYYFQEYANLTTSARVYFREVDTDIIFRTEHLHGLRRGGTVSYEPEVTFVTEYGLTYRFDFRDSRNSLKCTSLGMSEDDNIMNVYYELDKQCGDKTSATVYYREADTDDLIRIETLNNMIVGEPFTYKPLLSFTTGEGITYVFASDYPGHFLSRPLLFGSATKNTFSAFYKKQTDNTNGDVQDPSSFETEKKDLSKASVKVGKAVYSGKKLKPRLTVIYNGKSLEAGRDFTAQYKDSRKIGKASVSIKGKGGYTGKKKAFYMIRPKSGKIIRLSAQKNGQVNVKISKSKGAEGYEICYSDNKRFQREKKKRIKGNAVSLNGLKTGKTCYVRFRAYKKVKGKRIYSAYSPEKHI